MTTATVKPCGHRWRQSVEHQDDGLTDHVCDLPAGHPTTDRHRCRCGATTAKGTR